MAGIDIEICVDTTLIVQKIEKVKNCLTALESAIDELKDAKVEIKSK